jgi:peptidoglycan/LPS O-acetylase OafA/YrhL
VGDRTLEPQTLDDLAVNATGSVDARVRGHLPALDGYRGVAVLLVLLLHLLVMPFYEVTSPANWLEALVVGALSYGALGVDLFFVLSGYLITGILLDTKSTPGYFRNFYIRRVLRIFPLYYGVLALVFFVSPFISSLQGPSLDALRANQAWAWLYAVNVFAAARGAWSLPSIDHFWSLAVEEQFYLLWPLVVWLCSRPRLVMVALVVGSASCVLRVVLVGRINEVAIEALTPFRLDGLCAGATIAACVRDARGPDRLRRPLGVAAVCAGSLLVASHVFNSFHATLLEQLHEVRSTLFVVCFAVLLFHLIAAPSGVVAKRAFSSRPLRVLGKYSYGLYVIHPFVLLYLQHRPIEPWLAAYTGSQAVAVLIQGLLGIAGSMTLSIASFHVLEKRFLALKHLWPSPSHV